MTGNRGRAGEAAACQLLAGVCWLIMAACWLIAGLFVTDVLSVGWRLLGAACGLLAAGFILSGTINNRRRYSPKLN